MRMPDVEHYAIITTDTYTVPGDERSRTHPGHGYPEHTVETISYQTFMDEETLLSYLQRMSESDRSRARVIRAVPLSIRTEVKLSLT